MIPTCKNCKYSKKLKYYEYGMLVFPEPLIGLFCKKTIKTKFSKVIGLYKTNPLQCINTRTIFKCGKKGKWFEHK